MWYSHESLLIPSLPSYKYVIIVNNIIVHFAVDYHFFLLYLYLQLVNEISDNWASLPFGQHIPLCKTMLGVSTKAATRCVLGQHVTDDLMAKIDTAYNMVSLHHEQSLFRVHAPKLLNYIIPKII